MFFNGTAHKNHIDMDVQTCVNRDVKYFFEIECPHAASAQIEADQWTLPGLTIHLRADAPAPMVEKRSDSVIRVCYLAEVEKPETMHMQFHLDAEKTNE